MTDLNHFSQQELAWYRDRLSLFGSGAKIKSETDADVLCPVHGDRNPSLGVDLRRNGAGPQILLNCRSQGCSYEEILDAVGIESADFTFKPTGKAGGCTLDMYAAAKRLPKDFLTSDTIMLQDVEWWGVEAVEIPYTNEEGDVVLSRYRVSLRSTKTVPAVVSRRGDKVTFMGCSGSKTPRRPATSSYARARATATAPGFEGYPPLASQGWATGAKNGRATWQTYLTSWCWLSPIEVNSCGRPLTRLWRSGGA